MTLEPKPEYKVDVPIKRIITQIHPADNWWAVFPPLPGYVRDLRRIAIWAVVNVLYDSWIYYDEELNAKPKHSGWRMDSCEVVGLIMDKETHKLVLADEVEGFNGYQYGI